MSTILNQLIMLPKAIQTWIGSLIWRHESNHQTISYTNVTKEGKKVEEKHNQLISHVILFIGYSS